MRDSISVDPLMGWSCIPVHMLLSSDVWLVYNVMIVDKPVHATSTVAHEKGRKHYSTTTVSAS